MKETLRRTRVQCVQVPTLFTEIRVLGWRSVEKVGRHYVINTERGELPNGANGAHCRPVDSVKRRDNGVDGFGDAEQDHQHSSNEADACNDPGDCLGIVGCHSSPPVRLNTKAGVDHAYVYLAVVFGGRGLRRIADKAGR